MKKIIAFLLCGVMVFSFSACGKDSGGKTSSNASAGGSLNITMPAPKATTSRTDDAVGFQLEAPKIGEKVVVLETTIGDIVIRMFPESAPKTVENFITHADNGYYDGLIFHRVMNEFMIQGGDPKGNGTGGESIWGEKFEDEFNANLLNIRGSIAMANSGANTNGSQFFINQRKKASSKSNFPFESTFKEFTELKENIDYLTDLYNRNVDNAKQNYATLEDYIANFIADFIATDNVLRMDPRRVPDEVWELYNIYGGNIELDGAWKSQGGHTVFGQVIIGMNVVDSIAAVDTDSNNKPKTDVVIKRAYTTEYTREMDDNRDIIA